MPTARYNKQQICGILLQFGAGLGSGGERGLQGALGTRGDPREAGARREPRQPPCPRWGFFILLCKVQNSALYREIGL